MNEHLTAAEFHLLDDYLMSDDAPEETMDTSMLHGYLAAVASGPNLVMPDRMLRAVRSTRRADEVPANLIIRHYRAVNDALNDQVYVPHLSNPQAWCRGYLSGYAADLMAWSPLTAAQPELLKVIISGTASTDLADAARRIHAFWVQRRRQGTNIGELLGQLAALYPPQSALPTQPLH